MSPTPKDVNCDVQTTLIAQLFKIINCKKERKSEVFLKYVRKPFIILLSSKICCKESMQEGHLNGQIHNYM